MSKRMSEDVWSPDSDISKETMDRRIMSITHNFLSWQHIIRLTLERKIPFHMLKIAEVGCGTGTLSLTFALLGASVTLIDYNQRVLENAKEIYKLYGSEAEFIKADCMESPIADMRGKYDLVISSGLAEHFIGEDREKCIKYHKYLLKENGFACIGVPNKYSLFYQWIKLFKKLTGTWELEIEVPFSPNELKTLAEKVGFKKAYVLGNVTLMKDFIDYSIGFGSAVKQLLPVSFKKRLKTIRKGNTVQSYTPYDMRKYCNDMATLVGQGLLKKSRSLIVNNFSAGIYLFAFN